MNRALITYDGLPISSGGTHKIRSRNRESIWRTIEAFLSAFAHPTEPERARLLLYDRPMVDAAFVRAATPAISRVYGQCERRVAVSGAGGTVIECGWTVHRNECDAALALMRSLEPFPADPLGGPVVLSLSARFLLCHPATRAILPGQGHDLFGNQDAASGTKLGESYLYLRLGGRSTCSLFLSLPWPAVTDELRGYVGRIEAALPFPLSRHHWARWQLNRQRSAYYKRNVTWTG